ncbi:MAG: FHA domain-containing protein [Lachnospiraceae bacterium]|nr:FHA domain-containing protein [Lachnospiraceae bacterium]
MKRTITAIGVLLLLLVGFPVRAEQGQDGAGNAINEARSSVLRVNLSYVDESGENHVLRGESGFLIGDGDGAEYLITGFQVLNVTDELRDKVLADYGLPEEDRENLRFQIEVVIKGDITVSAAVVTSSEAMDFAVLKLSQTIYDKTPFVLNTDVEAVKEESKVYALGFPADLQETEGTSLYTESEVGVMQGIVSDKTTMQGVLYIRHSAMISGGNAGGPLLNEAGQVIGMNQQVQSDGQYCAIHIAEITSVLDALGIPYSKGVWEAEKEEGLKEPETTEEEEAVREEKPINYLLLIGGSLLLVCIVCGMVLLICIARKKEKTDGEKKEKKRGSDRHAFPDRDKDKEEETTLLKRAGGAEETTVLSVHGGSATPAAVLLRMKSNEKISINKGAFYLGKDGLRADYCIRDNPSVSRSHAVIKQINGEFYLEDLQATNGTFHNGRRLQPTQSVKLSDGDRIRLANEEFIFQM